MTTLYAVVHRQGYATFSGYASRLQAETAMHRNILPDLAHAYYVREMTWREREQYWLKTGAYQPPVWVNEQFWHVHYHIHRDHFPHVSLDDPSQIAFTDSPENGERDRQVRMKPGRYLTKYFGEVLTPKQIAYYAEWWQTGQRPRTDVECELKFVKSPEDIASVYIKGPKSCMGAAGMCFGHKDASEHPCRVYGAGDLELAYLETPEGKVIARAICWPEKNVFGRCYPAPENYSHDGWDSSDASLAIQQELRERLKARGWADVYEGGSLEGARLLKLKHNGHYVMPYLDNDYGVDDGGQYWFMSDSGEYDCQNTDGYLDYEGANYVECDRCGDDVDPDDTYGVYFSAGQRGGTREGAVCQHCYSHRTFHCEGFDEVFDDHVDRIYIEGATYTLAWFDANGGYTCDRTDGNYLADEAPPVEVHTEYGGVERWCPGAAADYAFKFDGEWYERGMESVEFPGIPEDLVDEQPPHVLLQHVDLFDTERVTELVLQSLASVFDPPEPAPLLPERTYHYAPTAAAYQVAALVTL